MYICIHIHIYKCTQLLKQAREYLEKRKAEVEDKCAEDQKAQEQWENFKINYGVPEKSPNGSGEGGTMFKDFLEIAEQSRRMRSGMHRQDVQAFDIDPNHSHFIFADDGSLNLLPNSEDTELRAAVQSCVAGVFKGVGVRQTGAGGKILQKIDDEIIRHTHIRDTTKSFTPCALNSSTSAWIFDVCIYTCVCVCVCVCVRA